jgi:NHL repeat
MLDEYRRRLLQMVIWTGGVLTSLYPQYSLAQGSVHLDPVSPPTAKPGQQVVIAAFVSYPVPGPCQITITQVGQSIPLATLGLEPSTIWIVPANAPLGNYEVVGACGSIESARETLTIGNPATITTFGPAPASIGMIQEVDGSGFGANQLSGSVSLLQTNGGPPTTAITQVTDWSDGRIIYTLPIVPTGTYDLAVHTASNGDSNSVGPYEVGPAIQHLWVADTQNNRILVFSTPIVTGQAANVAFAQVGLLRPGGIATDPGHDEIWISDTGNSRVVRMGVKSVEAPLGNSGQPDVIIGKTLACPSSPAPGPPASASTFCNPAGIAVDASDNLWVADTGNNRVLEFSPPYINGASLVIGQSNFTDNQCVTSATGLCQPEGVSLDPSGNLWVADTLNNRVLQYTRPFSSGEAAHIVLGQTNFNNNGYNGGYDFTQWNTLANPSSVVFDGSGNLWIADTQNDRVLEFIPTAQVNSGFPSVVIGQSSQYSGNVFNQNSCLHSSTATQISLCEPVFALFDNSGDMLVVDNIDNRLVEYSDSGPFSTGQAASIVIGQPGFSQKGYGTGPANLSLPMSATWQVFRGE